MRLLSFCKCGKLVSSKRKEVFTMTQTLTQLVSDLRSDNPSQRSVDIASTFLMSIYCVYKGHPSGGVVNPFVPVSEIDDCSINYLKKPQFSGS